MRDSGTYVFVVEVSVSLGGTAVVNDGDHDVADAVIVEVAAVEIEVVPSGGGAVERAFVDEDEVSGVGEFGARGQGGVAHVDCAVGLACHGGGVGILEVDAGDGCRSVDVDVGGANEVVAIAVVVAAVDRHHIGGAGAGSTDRVGLGRAGAHGVVDEAGEG